MNSALELWDLLIIANLVTAVLPISFIGLRMTWKHGQRKAITQDIDESGLKALRVSGWLWLALGVQIAVRLAYHWIAG